MNVKVAALVQLVCGLGLVALAMWGGLEHPNLAAAGGGMLTAFGLLALTGSRKA